jgi:hypothetical protein
MSASCLASFASYLLCEPTEQIAFVVDFEQSKAGTTQNLV